MAAEVISMQNLVSEVISMQNLWRHSDKPGPNVTGSATLIVTRASLGQTQQGNAIN
jgi:hypothetical protein